MKFILFHSSSFRNACIRISWLLIFITTFFAATPSFAQLVSTESFDNPTPTPIMPLGWLMSKYGTGSDPDNIWDRVNSGFFPTATPFGTAMMRFQSKIINPGESAYIVSKKYAMNGTGGNAMPAGGANFSFYFFRDSTSGWVSTLDRIQVYVNDSAVLTTGPTGATLLSEIGSGSSVIHRSRTQAPVTSVHGWNNYSYLIPNAAPYNGASVYVIILATSAWGNNMFLDNFSMTSYPAVQSYPGASASVVFDQNTNTTGINQNNQQIIGCKITMNGALSPKVLTNMEFNTNGSTSPMTDISQAKLYFTGGNQIFDIYTAVLIGTYQNPWATNFSFLTAPNANYSGMTSFNGLENGDNYFWLFYDIPPGAISNDVVDAEWIGHTISGSGTVVPSVQTLPGNRLIDVPYCIPTYIIGCYQNNYNNNDYINSVSITGGLFPDLNNNKNWILHYPGNANASQNCGIGPYPKDCPYQTHGPDYELFQEYNHPGYTAGRSTTKALKADGLTVYTISLQVGTWGGSNYIAAFLDFNHDGDFIDAGEKISQSGSLGGLGTYSTTFTVPTTATPGKTRLRVRETYGNPNIDPCATLYYGEAEDYVITITPDCPVYPGYTTWFGITDDWNDPNNWCPAVVPTSTTNVRFPGAASGAYQYVKAKIKTGVNASARKLRIEAGDTVFVDATSGSSLVVTDSLKITTPTSALKITSAFSDTVQVFNGTLGRPNESPLNTSERSRSIWMFTQAELQGQGLVANDKITNLLLHFQRKSNGNPYRNLNVRMYYTTTASFGVGPSAVPPLQTTAPVTVWTGDLNVSTFAAPLAYGTIDLALAVPFQWTGSANKLVIDICYDNTGFALTGLNDELKYTQTQSNRYFMNLKSLSANIIPACNLSPGNFVVIPASGTLGSNTITVPIGQVGNVFVGQLVQGGAYVTGGTTVTAVNVATGVVTLSTTTVTSNFSNVNFTFFNTSYINLAQYRPNITFRTSRSYNKFPITVAGHWENNGSFIPAFSRVTFNGTVANQKIDGTSNSTFYDLNIQNANHVVRYSDFTVTDSLRLVSGRLKLNNGKVSLTNQSLSALTYVAGTGIQADNDVISANAFPFGRIDWDMGSTPGIRTIPFVNTSGAQISLLYNIDSGTHHVTLGTYASAPNNLNIPLPEVTNILGVNNASGGGWGTDGYSMVDRYYLVDNAAGVTPQADITFSYAPAEQALIGNINMKAQRWMNSTDLWDLPLQPNQVFTAGNPNSVALFNYADFSDNSWWVIGPQNSPLGGDVYNDHTQCWYEVLAGFEFTVGIKNDSSLWSWGNNVSGQLGDGTNTSRNYPQLIGAPGNWLSAAVCLDHALAVKTNGTLWAWGNNASGQLGDGTFIAKNSPVQIGSGTTWKSVAAGENFSIGLKSDGTLWAWGNNSSGQLGTGNNVNYNQPVQIGTATNWKVISAGSFHALAIKIDGTLWAWGLNSSGALGNGTFINTNAPQQVGVLTDWKYASGGSGHSLALRNNGTLWSWGANTDGQLGNGTVVNSNVPGQVGAATNWVRLSNGWMHNHAIDSNGALWSWGKNQTGQLGDNTLVNKTSPVQIASSSTWQTVSAGNSNSFAVKSDGTLWAWGSNTQGQFGNATNTSSNIPVKNSYFSSFFALDTITNCAAPVALNAGPGYYNYIWNTGATTQNISANTTGWYFCTVTKTTCSTTDSVYVSITGPATTNVNASVCPGSSYTLPDGTVVNATGTYTTQIPTGNGCDSIVVVNLFVGDVIAPVVSSCPANFSTCSPAFWTPPQFSDNCSYSVTSNYVPGTFLLPGVYTVTYTATDAGNNITTCSFNVTVITVPVQPDSISSNMNYNNICAGQNVILTVNGGSPGFQGSWQWFTGSCGGTALPAFNGMSSITVSPAVTTTYFVRGSNSCNTTACASLTVIVSNNSPGNLVVVSLPTIGYIGGTGVITCNYDPQAVFYRWKLLNGSQSSVLFNGSIGPVETTINTVNLNFMQAQNNYNIRVISGNACGRSNNLNITVHGTVTPATCLNGPTVVCPLQTASYSVAACPIPNATGYQWSIQPPSAGTILSGQGNATVTVQFAAGYSGANVCVAGLSQSSIIGPQTCVSVAPSLPVIGAITGDLSPCSVSTGNYTVNPVAGATGYLWTTTIPGAVVSGTTTTGTVQFPAGSFTGQLCVQSVSACGSSLPSCTTITSQPIGVPGPITGPVSNLCGASNLNYSLGTNNANSYNWILPSGITLVSGGSTNSINVNFNSGTVGPQTITVQAFYDCNMSTSSIVVDGTPTIPVVTPATICPGTDQFYTATSGGPGMTYSWFATGVNTSYCINPNCSQYYADWLLSGCMLSVSATNSCGTSAVYNVPNVCRISRENVPEISIYPNPTDGEFTLEFESYNDKTRNLIISDQTGRVVLNKELPCTSSRMQFQLDLGNFEQGIYNLMLKDADGNMWMERINIIR